MKAAPEIGTASRPEQQAPVAYVVETGGDEIEKLKKSRELLRPCRPAGDTRELPGAMAPGSPGKAIEWVARVNTRPVAAHLGIGGALTSAASAAAARLSGITAHPSPNVLT